jgi:hypothetical protein
LGPDISISQSSTTEKSELLPSEAAVILSSLNYDESSSKLLVRGRISKLNSDRLNRISSQKGSTMKIKFNIFELDNKQHQWFSKLGSNGEITGTIDSIHIIQQDNDNQTSNQELIIELIPANHDVSEYIEYNNSPNSMKQIVWGGSSAQRIHCKTNKRDRIHEIIDSAVLL